MASIRTNFWDLRSYCILVILLVGYVTQGSANLSKGPKTCLTIEGNFDEEGRCKPCYKGECCTIRANNKPKFITEYGSEGSDKATIIEDGLVPNTLVYTAVAEDVDKEDACPREDSATVKCPCGDFNYTLADHYGVFTIDAESGQIRVPDIQKLRRQEYHLTVTAQNHDNSASAQLSLTIYSEVGDVNSAFNVERNDGYSNKDDFKHRIKKRSTTAPPGNVTFDLVKDSPNANLVEMKVGQKIGFTLTISFPNEDTNMLVELFTPDNDTTIMMLCGVKVQERGNNLNLGKNGDPILESIKNDLFYDRAIIDFGNVTVKSSSETNIINNQIVIKYEAVMLDTLVNNGSTYWVSAGAEYNNEEDVWVGQASFTCIKDDDEVYPGTPSVNFTGPDTMTIGSSEIFTVDLYMPYPKATLYFDAFAPLNTSNVMSICAVSGRDVAVNYECGFDITKLKDQLFAEGNVKGNSRGRLEIGTVFNKGARDNGNPDANNRITIQFVAHLYNDDSFVGQKYWVGAAIEINSDQIWAGQIEITAAAKTSGSGPAATLAQPEVSPGGGKASETKPVRILAKATIPESSTGDYRLEVKSSGPELKICSVVVSAVGGHLPCADTTAEPEYVMSSSTGNVEKVILELPGITNIGTWGSVNASSEPNAITFEAAVSATNYSTPSNSYNVEFAFVDISGTIPTKTVSVDVEAKAADQDIANDTVPEMKMEYKSGSENIPIKGASRVALEITTKRNVIYPVMDVEYIMPNDTEEDGHSPISICRTEITKAGRNIPCATKQAYNPKIYLDSKYKDKNYDRSVLSMGFLCNSEVVDDVLEDKLILESVVQLNTHSALSNGTQKWISAGVMFSDKMMWVGQLAAIAIADASALEAKVDPHIEVVTNTTVKTPVGYSAVYTLVIKTAADDHAAYTVDVTTSAAVLTICSARVLAKGHNLPCVDEDVKSSATTDASGRRTGALLDLGVVSNVGTSDINPNAIFDDNTLMIEIVIQLSKKASDATNYPFTIDTKYGAKNINKTVQVESTTDTSAVNMSTNASSTIEMGVLPITSTDDSSVVSKGQAKRIFLDIFVPMGSTQELTAKVLAPINQASKVEVSYIGLLDVGENLPCLNRDLTSANLIDRTTFNDKNAIGSLDLGVVCSVGVNKEDRLANRIRVEAVVRVLKTDTINIGDEIVLSGAVNTNNEIIAIVQHKLTVADNFTDIIGENMTLLNDTAIKLNITDDPIIMKVNEVKTIPIHLIIPPFLTTVVKFDVDLPVNDSAVLTFKELKVVGSGTNLAGYGNLDNEMTLTEKSTYNTSQINKVYADLGIVTNAGSTHRINETNYDDDVIKLELTLAMADSAINKADSTHWISLGVKIGIYIVILEHKVQVQKDGTEKPCIEFTGEIDNSLSSNTEVVINCLVKHGNESTAESTNMTAFVLFPPFLKFKAMNSINDSLLECSHSADIAIMRLTCSWFYFTDVLAFTAVLEQNTGYEVPVTVSGQDAVITLATASTMHDKTDDYSCNMNYVNHTVNVVKKTVTSCTSVALGLDSTAKIKDCQISGSPDYQSGGPLQGRKGGAGFSPYVRKGSLMRERYFQVYLGKKASIQKIEIAQSAGVGVQITKIQPKYSNDGYAWMDGGEITVSSVPSTVDVSDSIEARYVRIYIIDDNQQGQKSLGVTFELHGCYVTNDAPADLCTNVKEEEITNTDWHRSGFLNAGSNLYVCDAVAEDGLKQECYKSPDAGDSWEKLDERLGCMAGHDSAKGHLYALAHDGVTYMSSEDDGKTWSSVRKEKYDAAKVETGFTAPKKMKWEANAALEGASPDAAHSDGTWGATFNGVLKKNGGSWLLRFNWASCCGK